MVLQCVYACVHTCPLVLQNVAVPLNGDIDAIKKYAEEMQKIKKQVSVDFPMETIWLSDASACAAIQSEIYNILYGLLCRLEPWIL